MSNLKQWIIQLRYPYTAGVIAVMWFGSAMLAIIRQDMSADVLIGVVAIATLLIAVVGFSSSR